MEKVFPVNIAAFLKKILSLYENWFCGVMSKNHMPKKENIFIYFMCLHVPCNMLVTCNCMVYLGEWMLLSLRKQKEKCMDMCRIRMHLMCVCK